ncbi:MAG TPA: carboxypeptidase regulatory-like domain-containing protein [Candidatus Angelobacter sp.]|nr:carboxypeptidase regulatory-like domain-containing protein [Candidatus Angelobacter sp.]
MKAVFCTLLFCFSIAGLTAQTFRGSIQGTVADSSKAAVPGAQVTVMSPETGLKRTTITNDAGEYVVTELPLGAFDITVKKEGFRTQVLKGVRVEVAASQRVDVALEPGSVSESVDVTAQAPLVESAENNMGGTLEATQFSELPVNGRDFTKLLVMVPGSGGDPSGAADSAGSFGLFSINGNRGRSNNYLIDGTDMNDGYRNLPAINQGGVFGTPATVLPIDALDQISVINSTEAEYGRSSGATVNIVTKSGTNAIHGSAYEYFRNNALDARNFFNPVGNPQNAFHNNQFGFSLGGPLVKNKTFWFASYEGDREAVGIPTVATVPSQAQLNQAIADNGGVVNPVIANLLARNPWSLPANGSGSLITSDRASNRADSVIAKIDHHIGESDLLTARYFYSNSDQSFPLALVGGGILPGFNTVTPTNLNIASVSYTHVFTPAFLMETRFGYNRFDESFSPQDNAFNPNSIGLNTGTTAQDFGLPLITVKNLAPLGSTASGPSFAPLGAAASSPRGRIDTNWQFLNNFSYSAGRHHWKFGYEYRRTNVHGFFDNGYRGTLTFNTLDDFIAGMPSSGRQAQGNSTRNTFQNNNSLYLQDSFRLFPRLTINYGVRREYFGVIGETQNQFSILDPTGNLKQVSQLYPRDLNNFAPRASFAWDVFGNAKTVVRSGWGLYYDAFSQDFFVGQLPFNTFNAGPAYNGIGPNPITFSFSPTAVLQPGVQVFAPSTFGATDVFTVDQKLRTPYIQVYNLNIEQELAKNVALQVGYVGSAGRKLFRFLDLNQTNPATGTVAFPALGFVNQFQSSASSSYNSLQASLHLRDWHRLTSTVSYTWSHSIDNASDGQDYVPNASQPDNSFRPDLERASSNFDLRHHFSWAYGYRFPDPQSMKLLTNGWGLDGVLTLNAGQPYNVNYLFEGNFNGSGEGFGRPDLVGNPFAGTHTPGNFLNLSAFQVPCAVDGSGNCIPGTQHFGNLGRNAFTGPTYKNLDFSLVKDTKINERVSLQFRVNAFNILNHPNFANPLWPNFAVDFLQNGQSANGRGVGFLPITTTPDVGVGNPFLGGGGSRNLELAVRVKF